MARRWLVLAVLAPLWMAAAAACTSDPEPPVALDGSPRFPDDEGVATSLTHERITLDGRRTYEVSPALRSFSALTLDIEPMLVREGQYVQIGVDGDHMVWMAGVSAVSRALDPPSAFFTGTLEAVDEGRVVLTNGTVFRVGRGVDVPKPPADVALRIDVRRHVVISVTRQPGR